MRRLAIWLLGCGFALLAVACSAATSTTIQPTDRSTAASEGGPTTTPLRAPRNVYIPTEFDLLYYPTDLNLVGATGRPQFINAYADW
jgi:hypothetical protein